MFSFIKRIKQDLKKELNIYHICIGFITSIVVLHVNFLLSLRNEYSFFSFVEILACLVYPLTLLFFSLGQSSRSYFKLKAAKLLAIYSLFILFLIFYFSSILITRDLLRFIIISLNGSLFFFSMGRLSTQLRNEFELQVTKFIFLGKFIGIAFTLFSISYLGYNLLAFIALTLSFILFYGIKRNIIVILSTLFLLQLYYRQPIETYLTVHTFDRERIIGLKAAKMVGYKLQNQDIKTFWSLKGFAVLNRTEDDVYWWIHNFNAVYKSSQKTGHDKREKIYLNTLPEDKVLIIGIGGGMSLKYIPVISENIYSVDYDCAGLREFSKINIDLNKTTVKCTDASKIASHYPDTKFQYIYLETALTQNNQAQSPFFSGFHLLTYEALSSYKNMLDKDKGIFIFEVNRYSPRRQIVFGATLSNLTKIYGENNCKLIYDSLKYIKNHYVLCSHTPQRIQEFLADELQLNKSDYSADQNLTDSFPFIYVNNFMIRTFGTSYYNYFQILCVLIFLALIYRINKKESSSRLYWSEFFSNIQFYSLIYYVGGFIFDTSFSFLFISSINLITIFIVIQLKKKDFSFNKLHLIVYLLLCAILFCTVKDYSLGLYAKNPLIITTVSAIFILNSFLFKTNITNSFYKFTNLNIVLYVFYSLSATIAFAIVLLIGIFPTLLLSSAGYLWINMFLKAD